mmetsp:Transcript_11047/g.26594  ORF Transcript_11047/g.26594 Transcript_11047/m.26594 type:complete len:207 (+) Transcript_11047:137-757(+)
MSSDFAPMVQPTKSSRGISAEVTAPMSTKAPMCLFKWTTCPSRSKPGCISEIRVRFWKMSCVVKTVLSFLNCFTKHFTTSPTCTTSLAWRRRRLDRSDTCIEPCPAPSMFAFTHISSTAETVAVTESPISKFGGRAKRLGTHRLVPPKRPQSWKVASCRTKARRPINTADLPTWCRHVPEAEQAPRRLTATGMDATGWEKFFRRSL